MADEHGSPPEPQDRDELTPEEEAELIREAPAEARQSEHDEPPGRASDTGGHRYQN